jgi:hypothetical protein
MFFCPALGLLKGVDKKEHMEVIGSNVKLFIGVGWGKVRRLSNPPWFKVSVGERRKRQAGGLSVGDLLGVPAFRCIRPLENRSARWS